MVGYAREMKPLFPNFPQVVSSMDVVDIIIFNIIYADLGFDRDAFDKVLNLFGIVEDEIKEEDKNIIENINKTKPDFVWVGLGAPKQEKWMAEHQGEIDGLMLGVGAGFDYYAENIKRAPEWMQKSNLEWLYRLMQDPKRLFKRYFHTNTKFIWNAMIRGK